MHRVALSVSVDHAARIHLERPRVDGHPSSCPHSIHLCRGVDRLQHHIRVLRHQGRSGHQNGRATANRQHSPVLHREAVESVSSRRPHGAGGDDHVAGRHLRQNIGAEQDNGEAETQVLQDRSGTETRHGMVLLLCTRHTARDCVTIRNLFFGGWNGASLPAGHPYLCGLICVQPALPACPFGLNEGESVRMYSLVLPVVLAQAWLYWLDI